MRLQARATLAFLYFDVYGKRSYALKDLLRFKFSQQSVENCEPRRLHCELDFPEALLQNVLSPTLKS